MKCINVFLRCIKCVALYKKNVDASELLSPIWTKSNQTKFPPSISIYPFLSMMHQSELDPTALLHIGYDHSIQITIIYRFHNYHSAYLFRVSRS